MQDLHTIQTSQLVDLLAEQTSVVSKMFSEKRFGDDYEKQKMFLKAIQSEIDFRRNVADITSTNVTEAPDFT